MPSTRRGLTTLGAKPMTVRLVQCSSALSRSRLPGLDWALNPYRGCSHGCAYCYAQDVTRFDTSVPWGESVEVKVNLVQRLKKELEKGTKGVYGIGTVTDPYQPLEKKYELTRGALVVLKRHGARASVLSKSDLVLRDIDLLRSWPGVEVGMSISCLDDSLAALIEPRAPSPRKRFDAISRLTCEGVKSYLMIAPLIPSLTDSEENLRALVREAGEASVKSIIWDKFNPKPLATSRLRLRLATKGLKLRDPHTPEEARRIRQILLDECTSQGIELLDAF
jgi:DNA repair photolyase